jgi:hypothetical protein
MHLLRIAAIAVMICLLLGSMAIASDKLITIDSQYWGSTRDAVDAVKAYGGRAKVVVHPHFIFAEIPEDIEGQLLATRSVSGIYAGELDAADFAEYGRQARQVITAWNNVFMGNSARMGLDEDPAPGHLPLVNDVIYNDDSMILMKPPGAKIYDTSEFMLGNVVVGFVLAESNGAVDPETENWTTAEENNVTSEVIAGFNWYVTKAGWRDLTFYTVFHYAVGTPYEPINHSSSFTTTVLDSCLERLGYPNDNTYVRAIRDSFDADWGVVALVVDDSNDPDNCFTDGRFAFALLGGPRFVMTYGNDGWGIANMDAVMAHELGHSFFALDEYYEGYEGCAARSGYLSVENQNSEYPSGPGGCAVNRPFCIMRSVQLSVATVCNYTKGQIGWWDSDGDSIPDILDTCPETELYEYSPDPCSTFTPTYAGSSWVTMLPNLNPRKTNKHDITLNRIAKVEYRVDEGSWEDALPNDGAWDEGKEGFHFTTDPLTDTTHVIEARAIHSYGNSDTTFAVDTLTIGGSSGVGGVRGHVSLYFETCPNPFGPRVDIKFTVPGEYGSSVPVSMKIYDVRGREVAALIDGVRGPGPAKLAWDGTYANGNLAPSGIYFVDFVAGRSRVVRKLVLTR